MKGITPIIGIILLLLITVALVGSAYSFIFGIVGSSTTKDIKIVPFSEDEYKVTIQNLGTTAMNTSEIKIYVEGELANLRNPEIIQPGEGSILEFFPPSIGKSRRIRLVGPENSQNYITDLSFFPLFSCEQTNVPGFWQQNGIYKLVNDINSAGLCLNIFGADFLTIDCDGNKINNNANFGIVDKVQHSIIKNCVFNVSLSGILALNASHGIFENNKISNGGSMAEIILDSATDNVTLINNDVCGTGNQKIQIDSSDPQNANSFGNKCAVNSCTHVGPASNICDAVPTGNCTFTC